MNGEKSRRTTKLGKNNQNLTRIGKKKKMKKKVRMRYSVNQCNKIKTDKTKRNKIGLNQILQILKKKKKIN